MAATPAPATNGQADLNRPAQPGQPAHSATAAPIRTTPSPASPNIMPNISTYVTQARRTGLTSAYGTVP
ncbi:MAG TPA: hypothetical protein VIY52_09800 [Streptosporangiaceae bacterium]